MVCGLGKELSFEGGEMRARDSERLTEVGRVADIKRSSKFLSGKKRYTHRRGQNIWILM
jgi:hypothetical protein